MTNSNLTPAPTPAGAPAPAVQLATVLAGAKSFKDLGIRNLNDTYRGQILVGPSDVRTAIIKDIPLRELANEVVTAALGAALSLPVPKAFLALADPSILATSKAPKLGKSALLFASTDVSAPSVAQLALGQPNGGVVLQRIADQLSKSGQLGSFCGFDAWLANVDRHVGNILLGPQAYLIDHGRCYTGPTWTSADLVASTIFRHRLKEWLTPLLNAADQKKFASEAAALTTAFANVDLEALGQANRVPALLGDKDFTSLVAFLKERVVHVPRIASDALNQPVVI